MRENARQEGTVLGKEEGLREAQEEIEQIKEDLFERKRQQEQEYERLRKCFEDEDIYCGDGHFDRPKLASVIFSDEKKREALNAIVHPAVKEYVKQQAAMEAARGERKLLVLEAALLIEEHYDEICDELWYIDTSRENRRIRLKESRGYSDTKVDQIFESQLSEEEYRRHCSVVIDNNGLPDQTFEQIDEVLRRKAYE